MIIKELKLESFRSYEFLETPINSGVNLFYGDNGSGKSSIIESIYFSLTGKSFSTNDTNILRQNNKSLAQTLLVFDNGKSIKITIKHNKKAPNHRGFFYASPVGPKFNGIAGCS